MFSLILPFHSDFQRLEKTLEVLAKEADRRSIREILLCHNGKPLRPEQELEVQSHLFTGVRLLHTDGVGIGAGYKLGILNATQKICILSASDLPFGFTDLESFQRLAQNGQSSPAVAIGSKAHPQSRIVGYGLKRKLASAGFWALRAALLGKDTPKDSQGSILIDTQVARSVLGECAHDNYFFSLELVTLAQKRGHRVVELPVVLENHEGESSVSVWKDGARLAADLWTFSRRLKK